MRGERGSEVGQTSTMPADALVSRCIAACAEVTQQLQRTEELDDLPLRIYDDLEHVAVYAAGPLSQNRLRISRGSAALLQIAGKWYHLSVSSLRTSLTPQLFQDQRCGMQSQMQQKRLNLFLWDMLLVGT